MTAVHAQTLPPFVPALLLGETSVGLRLSSREGYRAAGTLVPFLVDRRSAAGLLLATVGAATLREESCLPAA